ncbi:ABC transporter permease subunit [Proteinivorax hydrogeniformans]|uniref:ABC transporter permease subunit n=1 Tax=Proteinivorax hydrogeniformans TaxID=1826727 RepID=A0AAU8HVE9_9FIRM
MANHKEFLYDDIGNKYKRKNLYLLDVALLEKEIKQAKGEAQEKLKNKLKTVIKNKDAHPYNIELEKFRKEEKKFLNKLKEEKKTFDGALEKELPRKLRKLKLNLFEHKQKLEFYKDYTDLCYDAEFAYGESKFSVEQLPNIIDSYKSNLKELRKAKESYKSIDVTEEKRKKEELKQFKSEQKELLNEGKKRLKERRRKGQISKKAESTKVEELKKKFNQAINLKSYDIPRKAVKEDIKKARFELKNGTKLKLNVLQADIADLRRKTPMETEKTKPILAYFTFLIPGLGQMLNKQVEKGILFFLATFFVYFAAIPYALGYGNYQGEGVAGLITLAEGGPRIYQSLIFMIEGVIAILLLIIAFGLLYISFKDVLNVEKKKIKGVRPSNWHETMDDISKNGFPYIVSLPALFIIIFVVFVPLITTVLISFTSMSPQEQTRFTWIGIENYRMIALGEGLAGSVFWLVLRWTLVWTIGATTLAIFIGFVLALLVNNERVVGKKFFRTVYLLPWAVPAFITIMFFSIMTSPNGALTVFLSELFDQRIHIKSDPQLTRAFLILLQGWLGSAYVFLLTTGVLQAIPSDLYEAADIDGATDWQKTKRITIPIVLFQTAPLLITQYVFNFNNFSIIKFFNGGGPYEPSVYGNLAGSSDILISYIYKLTMNNQQQAVGAAIIVVISIGLLLFGYMGLKNSKAFKEERL